MKTIDPARVPADDLSTLETAIKSMSADSPLTEGLAAVSESVRSSQPVVVAQEDDEVTAPLAARMLGMSRTHLYKLLDAGDIPFARVGRDRRVRVADLRRFDAQRDNERKAMAERFANSDAVRKRALDSL